jgi:hypothetical protein
VLEAVGATHFAGLYLKRDGGNVAIDRSISNLPRGWQELCLEQGYTSSRAMTLPTLFSRASRAVGHAVIGMN